MGVKSKEEETSMKKKDIMEWQGLTATGYMMIMTAS